MMTRDQHTGYSWKTTAWFFIFLAHVTWHMSPGVAEAGEAPSLFRGVVVADSPVGVRVVSVDDSSQAHLADLRPEDIIIRIEGRQVQSIDDFATLSLALKGREVTTTVVVFRHGTPHRIPLHLYSYPVLNAWGIEFVPDDDIRFAQSDVGLAYWMRMGRGFEEAEKPADALAAYLNGLHNVPTDTGAAVKAAELILGLGQQHLDHGEVAQGVDALSQAMALMERLFDHPLTDRQLSRLKRQLQTILQALRTLRSS